MTTAAPAGHPTTTGPSKAQLLVGAGAFVFFGIGGFFLSTLLLPCVWLAGFGGVASRRKRCQRVVSWGFGCFHRYLQAVGLATVEPDLRNGAASPAVYVANHPTLIDVTVIMRHIPEMCVVVKTAVYFNPILFLLHVCCGNIRVPRSMSARIGALQTLIGRIERGHSVLVFPEGTRSPIGEMHPFQRGAFEVAARAERPIQPLAINVSEPFLAAGSSWYHVPASCSLIRLESLPALAAGSSRRTSAAVASAIRGALD